METPHERKADDTLVIVNVLAAFSSILVETVYTGSLILSLTAKSYKAHTVIHDMDGTLVDRRVVERVAY